MSIQRHEIHNILFLCLLKKEIGGRSKAEGTSEDDRQTDRETYRQAGGTGVGRELQNSLVRGSVWPVGPVRLRASRVARRHQQVWHKKNRVCRCDSFHSQTSAATLFLEVISSREYGRSEVTGTFFRRCRFILFHKEQQLHRSSEECITVRASTKMVLIIFLI